MSSKKSLTPQIRFKGFTEAWEQRKLGETFCITMGQSPSSANYTSNPDDYVLVQGNADLQNGWVYPRVWTTQVTKSAEPGTLIMSVRAPVGAMGKTAYKIVLGRGVAGIQGPEILFQLFKKYESEGYWIKKSTGSTFDSINGDELKNTLVTLPNISPEQTDIENLLIRLDSLITLHQRKLDALKKTKSSLLEKMFPKDGSNIPEIRFTGFTEAWEQRKLSELTTMHARIGWQNLRTSEFLDSGNYYLITGTDFENGYVNLSTCHYVNKDRYDQDPNIQIDNGSILITKDGTLGKVALVQGLDKPATLNAGVFNVVIRNEEIVDNGYLYQYLKAPFLLNYVAQTATGGTIKHLNQSILVDFPVSMPSKGEQKLIGDAFLRLDNLITLHQRKLDALKKIKSALLEKMFV